MASYDLATTLESKGQVLEFYSTFAGIQVSFKAFLDTYSDNINCKWQPAPTFGRPDPIQVYTGTDRAISLGWTIPAFSLEDAKSNLMKTSTLARMFYPEYSSVDNANTISKAPLIKIKFANLIYDAARGPGGDVRNNGLLGAASGMQWSPVINDGFFDPGNELYPKTIKVSISNFAVLHQHSVGWEKLETIDVSDKQAKRMRGDATGDDLAAIDSKIDDINSTRADASQAAAPKWGSDAALFPWSAAAIRANTNIGTDPEGIIVGNDINNMFKGKK